MADDIVTRLREEIDSLKVDVQVLREAADEIERLRSALDAEGNDTNLLMLEIKRLRAAGDALVAAISALPIQRFDEGLAVINAMHDWEGVRNA